MFLKGLVVSGLVAGFSAYLVRRKKMDIHSRIYCAFCASQMTFKEGGSVQFHLPVIGWQSVRVCLICFEAAQRNGPSESIKLEPTVNESQDEKVKKLLEWD